MHNSVIRLGSSGPDEGLEFWGNCDNENVVAGSPVETGHEYFRNATGALSSGVWECTAYTAVFDAYPVDEFCYILSGQVTITDDTGTETFSAGECFVIPKGLKCTWEMLETVRKFYVILEPQA